MKQMETRKRRRHRLFEEQGGKCHWFHQGTASPTCVARKGVMDQNFKRNKGASVTFDHLYDRFDPRRWEPEGGTHQVLACADCNGWRARQRHESLPSEVKLKLSSGKGIKAKKVAHLIPQGASASEREIIP